MSDNLPDPEAKHILTESDTLVVLEYPEHLSHSDIDAIARELRDQGIACFLILGNGATLATVDEETMRRLGWVRESKEDQQNSIRQRADEYPRRSRNIDTLYRLGSITEDERSKLQAQLRSDIRHAEGYEPLPGDPAPSAKVKEVTGE